PRRRPADQPKRAAGDGHGLGAQEHVLDGDRRAGQAARRTHDPRRAAPRDAALGPSRAPHHRRLIRRRPGLLRAAGEYTLPGHGARHRPARPHGRAVMGYRWPRGKRCAAVLSFGFDAESGFIFREPEKARRSLADLEERRFGPRVGVDRILRLLDRLKLRATFFIAGWTVVNHLAPSRRLRDAR